MNKVKIYQGDCLKIMKTIKNKSIDMILTDLPYGIIACEWDNIIPFNFMWKQIERIIKNNGAICLFGNEPFSSRLRLSNLKMFKYDWIWEKTMPSGIAQASYMPMKYHENISVFVKFGKPIYNKQMAERSEMGKTRAKTPIQSSGNLFHSNLKPQKAKQYNPIKVNPKSILKFGSVPNSKGKLHPTQKPIDLLEYLIKTYTLEGEVILDFTMGSGSTGMACKNLNRSFIGIELNKKYFEIAKKRLNLKKKRRKK